MKNIIKMFVLLSFALSFSAPVFAGWTKEAKQDANKAWNSTKKTGSAIGQDMKDAYHKGKNTSLSHLEKDAKKQGLQPVKPKENQAGIPK